MWGLDALKVDAVQPGFTDRGMWGFREAFGFLRIKWLSLSMDRPRLPGIQS